jgi:tetratricopeptide (TPR) repeat protein
MKKNLTGLFIFLILSTSYLSAFDSREFSLRYNSLINGWINNETDADKTESLISRLEEDLRIPTEDFNTLYWQSRLSFFRGRIYYDLGKKELSIKALEETLRLAEKANKRKETSDILSTMAEAYGLLILQKNFLFSLGNHTFPLKYSQKALELNPKDSRASLVLGQFLCNAPAIAGGDFEQGVSILEAQSGRSDLTDPEKFNILMSLGEIYSEKKREQEAVEAFREALSVFPGNEKCRLQLSELDSN